MARAEVANPSLVAEVVSRSLFPWMALALLTSSLWIGPSWFLALTFVWWRLVTRIG
ncbi:MAG: hypothetical protein ABIP94_16355 [Planctomycetota bacterium]